MPCIVHLFLSSCAVSSSSVVRTCASFGIIVIPLPGWLYVSDFQSRTGLPICLHTCLHIPLWTYDSPFSSACMLLLSLLSYTRLVPRHLRRTSLLAG